MTLLVAGIPALASVGAAVAAGVFARRTRRDDAAVQRARDLESRISDRKYQVYEPMINYLRDLTQKREAAEQVEAVSGQAQAAERFRDFSTWIGIYGSDGAVQTFHNFMQAAYRNPLSGVLMRLYGDFMVEARKDMGYPDTTVRREHLLGMKITDIYEIPDVTDPSFAEICERLDWKPPWLSPDVVPRQPE
ncbi:MAG: hypothetical protein ACRDRI_10120 [Pseudonocardiaceae bacterium]